MFGRQSVSNTFDLWKCIEKKRVSHVVSTQDPGVGAEQQEQTRTLADLQSRSPCWQVAQTKCYKMVCERWEIPQNVRTIMKRRKAKTIAWHAAARAVEEDEVDWGVAERSRETRHTARDDHQPDHISILSIRLDQMRHTSCPHLNKCA